MQKTELLGLNLPEGSDPLSAKPLNENFRSLEAALSARGRLAVGSYVGTVPTEEATTYYDFYSTKYTRCFGDPANSEADVTITLDFEPRLFFLTACREGEVAWNGVYTGYTGVDGKVVTQKNYTGIESQMMKLSAVVGAPVNEMELCARYPSLYWNEYNHKVFEWVEEHKAVLTRVECTDGGSGTWTLSVKGGDGERGSVNFANAEGVTYRWVAVG